MYDIRGNDALTPVLIVVIVRTVVIPEREVSYCTEKSLIFIFDLLDQAETKRT